MWHSQVWFVRHPFISTLSTNNSWIIDTGATYHMTNNPKSVKTLNPSSQVVISTADGSLTLAIKEDYTILFASLTLDSVLKILSLSHNLLSVSQIIMILACSVIFLAFFMCVSRH